MGIKSIKITVFFISLILLFNSEAAFSRDVKVYYKKSSAGGYDFYADNNFNIDCWVKIEFPAIKNLELSVDLPFSKSLSANSKKKFLFKARPVSKRKGYSMKYSYLSIKGDPSASHDDSYRYLFPYRHGAKFKISQGYKGKATHYGENKYSLDFGMKTGTRIVAAREGLVVEVKEDSNIGGPEKKYDKHGNYVLIYHSDGTFANYVHLKQNGAIVNVNDRVNAGQLIGLSGNTGRSSGPHLHFSVSKPTYSGKRVTIPVKFLNYNGESVDPEVGRYYYSTHYGKDGYKVILGDDIRNEQYESYFKKIKSTGKVKFRTEVIDDTILVFVRNGTNSKISMVADFKLENLSPSKGIPVKSVVRPHSEVFVCFLRRIDNKKGYSFSTQCQYRKTK